MKIYEKGDKRVIFYHFLYFHIHSHKQVQWDLSRQFESNTDSLYLNRYCIIFYLAENIVLCPVHERIRHNLWAFMTNIIQTIDILLSSPKNVFKFLQALKFFGQIDISTGQGTILTFVVLWYGTNIKGKFEKVKY